MKLEKRSTCPLCHSKDTSNYRKSTFNPLEIGSENFKITDSHYGSVWDFSTCSNCGFVFSNPYVPEEHIIDFYSQLEDLEYSTEADGRAKNFEVILKRLQKLDKAGKSLLDIGAASGIFLDLARKAPYDYDITGIEPSAMLVEEAKKLYNIELFQGTIENFVPTAGQKFAVITLLDILEHLVNPDAFMEKISTLMEEKGILVIVTPDIGSLAARWAGQRWWHYRIAHVNFFNLKSLTYLLKNHGFEILMKKRYAWNFSLFYLVTRIFPALKDKNTLQKVLKRVNLKLQLFDSWEIYAGKK